MASVPQNTPRPMSVLDLAQTGESESVADGIARSVRLAQAADELGFHRVWFAEHHNMRSVASSATSLIIQLVASQTRRIRVGSGGIMLPNHSPLVIAEQFGTLETLYPGRIDLGLGRAPGTDMATERALRRDGSEVGRFAQDILELHGYLTGHTRVPGVNAHPGFGTDVPLIILGSSDYGAQLAAQLGVPFAFASHFAPHADTISQLYRDRFDPNGPLAGEDAEPYFIAAVNAIAADDVAAAQQQLHKAENGRLRDMLGRNAPLSDEEVESLRPQPAAQQVIAMINNLFIGIAGTVIDGIDAFADNVAADEIMFINLAPNEAHKRRTLELLAPAPPPADPVAATPGPTRTDAGGTPR